MEFTHTSIAVDLTYAATLLAPWGCLVSFRLAKKKRYERHRALQLGLLAVCWASVLGFEVTLRLAGGSGAFLQAAAPSLRGYARALLMVHVSAAVITYAGWTWLALASQRRFRAILPGRFSARHRTLGRWIWFGLWFTAASATGMYVLVFVRPN